MPYFARKRLKFRRSPKDGNYTTPEEIDEMRELQQVTTTVPDAAKKMPPDRRKRDENSMRRGGGKVRLRRAGNREREDKKGKRVNR